VQANKDIHIAVPRGTIRGIIEENGAGLFVQRLCREYALPNLCSRL
jgi:ABC-type Na+ transport system ATPase subunit NatA